MKKWDLTRMAFPFFSYFWIFLFLSVFVERTPAPPALLPTKTSYNEDEAKILLNLSAGAYAISPQACLNRTFGSDASLYRLYTATNAVCDIVNSICSGYTVIDDKEKKIFVVFRGTKTGKQLFFEGWNSLGSLKDFYGVGLANKYFLNALEILWPNVEPALTDSRYMNYSVTFTGHSLGGALASLAALKTVIQNIRPNSQIRVITFGQPRIGNIDLAQKHNELLPESYRVVHSEDIVPHLPACAKDKNAPGIDEKDDSKPCDPTNTEENYHHGIEIWYPTDMYSNSTYYECLGSPYGEDFDCSDMLSFEFSKYKRYIAAHRYYFGHRVPSYGKLGCDPNNPYEKKMNDSIQTLPQSTFGENVQNKAKSAWKSFVEKIKRFGGN
ncbi:hypothetical protein FO519_006579 [Halicephalobus sp. NKZ332]|nr:hypothetical protein FO519_006579 [Halicephalobus sp. NKZ332]